MRRRAVGMMVLAAALAGAPGAGAAGWTTPIDVAPGAAGSVPALSVGADGTAAMAWTAEVGGHDVVRVSVRPPGGAFSASRTLSDPAADVPSPPTVAVDDRDGVTVVWAAAAAVQAAYRPAGGDWPATPQGLAASAPIAVDVAAGPGGRAIAVWSRAVPGGVRVESALRPPDAAPFGVATPVSGLLTTVIGRPRAALDAAGDAAVLWQGRFDPGDGQQHDVAQVSVRAAAQSFPTGVLNLSSTAGNAYTANYDLAMTPAGRVTAMWDYYDGTQRVYVADRTPGATFATGTWGPSTAVSAAGGTTPVLALDAAGDAQALWSTDFSGGLAGGLRALSGGFAATPLGPGFDASISTSAAGETSASWGTADQATILVSRRSPDGAFGPPLTVAQTSGGGNSLHGGPVGVDDQGSTYVAWEAVSGADAAERIAVYDAGAPTLSAVTATVAGADAAFSATATDRISGVRVHWDFGDGAAADGASVTHRYAASGTYTATVTATDDAGNATSATRTVAITVPAAPASPAGPPALPGTPAPPAKPALKPVPGAKVAAKWKHLSKGRTGVRTLSVTGAKSGDTIKLACAGTGCGKLQQKAKTLTAKKVKQATVSLATDLKALKLSPKAKLTITISRKGYKSVVITYTMVKGKDPKRTVR